MQYVSVTFMYQSNAYYFFIDTYNPKKKKKKNTKLYVICVYLGLRAFCAVACKAIFQQLKRKISSSYIQ